MEPQINCAMTVLETRSCKTNFLKSNSRKIAGLKAGLLALTLFTAAVPAWSAKDAPAPAAEAPKTVNINTADAATLAAALKGVGQSKAEAIVAYRKEHGAFKSPEQLADVKGIGDKLVQSNHDRIVVK